MAHPHSYQVLTPETLQCEIFLDPFPIHYLWRELYVLDSIDDEARRVSHISVNVKYLQDIGDGSDQIQSGDSGHEKGGTQKFLAVHSHCEK